MQKPKKIKAKCCETCEYYYEYNERQVCLNNASENAHKYMEPDDCCFDYEEKENLSRDEIIGLLLENSMEAQRLIKKLKECDCD